MQLHRVLSRDDIPGETYKYARIAKQKFNLYTLVCSRVQLFLSQLEFSPAINH